MSVGMLLLSSAREPHLLFAASCLLGVGNGLSSGLVMTIGQDAAPPAARPRFIGLFKVFTDCGTFAGPAAVGLYAKAFTLDAATTFVGVLTMLAAALYAAQGRIMVCPSTLSRK